jgi:hypothetical protein
MGETEGHLFLLLIPMNWGMNMNSKIQPQNPNPEKENPYLNSSESQGLKREN